MGSYLQIFFSPLYKELCNLYLYCAKNYITACLPYTVIDQFCGSMRRCKIGWKERKAFLTSISIVKVFHCKRQLPGLFLTFFFVPHKGCFYERDHWDQVLWKKSGDGFIAKLEGQACLSCSLMLRSVICHVNKTL